MGRKNKMTTRQWTGLENKELQKQKENKSMYKIGTWNVRSIQGKEKELEEEFEEIELEILAITETKKKGNGMFTTEKGNVFIYSGVETNKRAAAGIGCIINQRIAEQISKWKAWSERILSVDLVNKNKNAKTIIVIYGPNEDDTAENKNKFWEELTKATEEAEGKIFIMGDFNSRVGKKDDIYKTVVGMHGETVRNNNGERMLDFCIINRLIITNTFFEHKDIHKYTREIKSRNEKSIIDYILVEEDNRQIVLDTKVRRGPEIDSDHYLVITKLREELEEKNEHKRDKVIEYESIRTYKLLEQESAIRYKNTLDKKCKNEQDEGRNVEELWNYFKNAVLETAKEICGITRKTNKNRQTAWWSEEIKTQVRIKKRRWKDYINNRTPEKYELYKTERKKVKELVTMSKKQKWKEFGDKMERDSKNNQKLFYKTLKTLRTDKSQEVNHIKNKNGEIITEDSEIMKRWKEYFQELLGNNRDTEQRTRQREIIEENNDQNITAKELNDVIRNLKNGKAPGHDKITSEMIKNMGTEAKKILLKIYNMIWNIEQIPNDWQKALIVPIYKKGDRYDCNNYRGITLLCVGMKIYEQILDTKIRKAIEDTLEESQSGFRKGRSTQDHIFTVKQIIEKSVVQEKTVFMGFIDLEKAFDKVPRERLWEILERRGINKKIIRIIKNIYENNTNSVISQNRRSEPFNTKEGLRQGGGLSPLLFTIYIDEIIKKCSKVTKKLHVGYKNLQRINISEGAFADDIMILTENEKDLQTNLEIWNKTLDEYGMTLNKNKTKVMVVGGEQVKMNIKIGGIKIEQVTTFKYLGVNIAESGRQDKEINDRIEKTMKLYHIMNKTFIGKQEISKETKINVFKSIFRPILTFGCESWVLTQRMKNKLQAVEMKFLRRIRGVTKMDRLKNVKIREELKIQSTLDFIERRQLSWWGHLHRMKNERPVKQIWQAKIKKRRKRGRPRKTWDSVIEEIIRNKGKTWTNARELAANKKEWARFVHEL